MPWTAQHQLRAVIHIQPDVCPTVAVLLGRGQHFDFDPFPRLKGRFIIFSRSKDVRNARLLRHIVMQLTVSGAETAHCGHADRATVMMLLQAAIWMPRHIHATLFAHPYLSIPVVHLTAHVQFDGGCIGNAIVPIDVCTTHPVRKLLSAGRQRYVHPCAIAGTGDDVHLFIAQHHAASCCSWRTMLPFSIQCDSTESGSEVGCCFNVAKRRAVLSSPFSTSMSSQPRSSARAGTSSTSTRSSTRHLMPDTSATACATIASARHLNDSDYIR